MTEVKTARQQIKEILEDVGCNYLTGEYSRQGLDLDECVEQIYQAVKAEVEDRQIEVLSRLTAFNMALQEHATKLQEAERIADKVRAYWNEYPDRP